MMNGSKTLTVSYISNQFGPPTDVINIVSKNAGWEKIEPSIKICGKLNRLDLDNNSLSQISPVFEIPSITQLSVAHNRIISIVGIYKLGYLKQLNVAHNQLTSLEALTACTELRVLIANNNHLTKLPTPLPKHLSFLVVSHNQLTDLTGVETCLSLTKLSASHNELTTIPQTITKLSKLVELRLNHNSLTALPGSSEEFGTSLKNLKLLDLGNNRFTDLDPLLAAFRPMKELRNLNLKGNPIERRGQLIQQENKDEGFNSHFLHTLDTTSAAAAAAAASSTSSTTDPSSATSATSSSTTAPPLVTPANSVSSPTHPPAYFVALKTALPRLLILDTKKMAEHEIKFRQIAEKATGGGAGGKEGKRLNLTTNKQGKVIEKVKGVKKHTQKPKPLTALKQLEAEMNGEIVVKKEKSHKKQNRRNVDPNAAAAGQTISGSGSPSLRPISASPSKSPSTSSKKLQLPPDLRQKNDARKQKQREKRQADLLQAQLKSGGEGAKLAQEELARQHEKKLVADGGDGFIPMPKDHSAQNLKNAKKKPATAMNTPQKGGNSQEGNNKKRKHEGGSGTDKDKDRPKKAKPFSTMDKKAATLATMNTSTSIASPTIRPNTPSKQHQHQQNRPSTPKQNQPMKSPKHQSNQQQQPLKSPPSTKSPHKSTSTHHPNESISATASSEPAHKKQKTNSGGATAASSSNGGAVVEVRRTGSSSFSVDALNSTYSKVDHVGAAPTVPGGGWVIDTKPSQPFGSPTHSSQKQQTKSKPQSSPSHKPTASASSSSTSSATPMEF